MDYNALLICGYIKTVPFHQKKVQNSVNFVFYSHFIDTHSHKAIFVQKFKLKYNKCTVNQYNTMKK